MVGLAHGRPCMPCWDGIMAGLTCGELALWADLVCSDGVVVVVVVDWHVVKMEAAIGLCVVRQRWQQGLARLKG